MAQQFPIGGPRQAVYAALQRHGFVMSKHSDKSWQRADGLDAHVYGAGSMLRVYGEKFQDDGPLGEVLANLSALAPAQADAAS